MLILSVIGVRGWLLKVMVSFVLCLLIFWWSRLWRLLIVFVGLRLCCSGWMLFCWNRLSMLVRLVLIFV